MNKSLTNWMYGYVVVLVFASVLAHILGIFHIAVGDAPTVNHIVMTVLDVMLLIAVLVRGKLAFAYMIAMFCYAITAQSYWTFEAIINGYDQPYLQGFMAFLVSVAGLCIFIQRRFFLSGRAFGASP